MFYRHKFDGLGSLIEGNELIDSGFHLKFKHDYIGKVCSLTLNAENSQDFAFAVQNHYWFQLYLGTYMYKYYVMCRLFISFTVVYFGTDELPLWGMVGEMLHESELVHLSHLGLVGPVTHSDCTIAVDLFCLNFFFSCSSLVSDFFLFNLNSHHGRPTR